MMKSNDENNHTIDEITESNSHSRIRRQNISGYKEERPNLGDDDYP